MLQHLVSCLLFLKLININKMRLLQKDSHPRVVLSGMHSSQQL